MPVWFEVAIPQSWAWKLLAPYISSCPMNQTRVTWQNFPQLYILNQLEPFHVNGSSVFNDTTCQYDNTVNTSGVAPSQSCINKTAGQNCTPAITQTRTSPLSYPGCQAFLKWDSPGQLLGPNNSFVTNTTANRPWFALGANQLNATYSPLQNVTKNTAYTFPTFAGDPTINGTLFLALMDEQLYITPYNLSMVNRHVYALGLYQAG